MVEYHGLSLSVSKVIEPFSPSEGKIPTIFATHALRWDSLARIAESERIEDLLHSQHRIERVLIEDHWHVVDLVGPDTMFTGNRATGIDTELHDLFAGDEDTFDLVLVATVKIEIGMKVSIDRKSTRLNSSHRT